MTLPLLPSPPLVPLTPSQIRFLALHARFAVYRWQWYFMDTMLRAHAVKFSAAISRADLFDLFEQGMMTSGHGVSVVITDIGRDAVEPEKETAK